MHSTFNMMDISLRDDIYSEFGGALPVAWVGDQMISNNIMVLRSFDWTLFVCFICRSNKPDKMPLFKKEELK